MIRLKKDDVTRHWNLVFGKKGNTFIHATNDWAQFYCLLTGKTKYNWYTFDIVKVYFENDIICPGFEVEIALLGIGLRFRHNRSWEDTEMQKRIDDVKEMRERKKAEGQASNDEENDE